jgi:hypothetical protein
MDNIPNEYRCRTFPTTTTTGNGGLGNLILNTDAFGRLQVSNPVTLFDSQNRYKLSEKFYSNVVDGASITFSSNESAVYMNVTTSANAYAARESRFVFNYQPGKSILIMNSFVFSSAMSGLVQRVGYFGTENGYYLQLSDYNLSFVQRSNVTGNIYEEIIPQNSWNMDKLDGTGPSKVTLDITKSQLLYTDIEWLGVGTVRIGFVIDGIFILCHKFNHANKVPMTYITTACLPIRYEIFNTKTTSSESTLKQICSTVISEGGYEPKEQLFCAIGPITGQTLTNVLIPVCTVRLASGRLDAIVLLKQINVAVNTNNDLAQWYLVLNGTLTNATFTGSTGGSTNVEIDTSATAISGGRNIEVGYAQTGSINTSLQSSFFEAHLGRNSFIQKSDTISLCVVGLSQNPKIFWSLGWSELI